MKKIGTTIIVLLTVITYTIIPVGKGKILNIVVSESNGPGSSGSSGSNGG